MILSRNNHDEVQKEMRSVLSKELGANLLEKGPNVMLDELIHQSVIEEYGQDLEYNQKVGKRAFLRIVENTNNKLRARYGSYAALSSVKLHGERILVSCNLHNIYKTKNGWIYGVPKTNYRNIFFSTHSIDRFKERTDHEFTSEWFEQKDKCKDYSLEYHVVEKCRKHYCARHGVKYRPTY